MSEIPTAIDSLQLTANHILATPADWKHGEDVIISPRISNEEANDTFPGFVTVKPYLRSTPDPTK